jgi:mono/diheme cytochrome c family protein
VNPNGHDSDDEMRAEVKRHAFTARYVPDRDQRLSRALGARSTTDVFVLDAARTLVYRSAVDDRFGLGYALPEPRNRYLRDALESVLAGGEPAVPATSAPGCLLRLEPAAGRPQEVTWHNRISCIVQRNCQECHRPGENAPFPLLTHEDLEGNAEMARYVVEARTMPPWFGGDGVPMASDRRLPEADRRDLLAWIAAGCPEGDAADAPLPRSWTKGWRIGEPDHVVEVPRPYPVRADGWIPYVYWRVDAGIDRDRWVRGFEVRVDHPEVVHHVLVFCEYPEDHPRYGERPRTRNGLSGYFAAMVPGQSHLVFPQGVAKFLPKGARLRFQVHYTPNGEARKDRPKVGLLFNDGPPEREIESRSAFNVRFRIPPGAKSHRVRATHAFRESGTITALMPHMHVRGTAFRYELQLPDGERKLLLDVPRYDFNWQLVYRLRDPVEVPAGARLHATAWYDNSAGNPANPDPTRTVRFGEQTWDEMMIGYFDWVGSE